MKRTYWFGPMPLEEYIGKEDEIHELFQGVSDNNPNVDVQTQLVTTDFKELFFIKIVIDEYEDN